MPIRDIASDLTTLAAGIDESETLDDLGAAIDKFSDSAPYQVIHIGLCKIDNVIAKDILYTRNMKGAAVGPNDFGEVLKLKVILEAVHTMRPFELLSHDFETCDARIFEPVRAAAKALKVDGVMVIPYRHLNTISATLILCSKKYFQDNIESILPSIYLLVSKIFARFPSLAVWPEEYRLSNREAQVLQISSTGARELDIAKELGLSVSTIRNHVENAKRKLDARNKAHAIAIALQSGEIDLLSHRRTRH